MKLITTGLILIFLVLAYSFAEDAPADTIVEKLVKSADNYYQLVQDLEEIVKSMPTPTPAPTPRPRG